MHDIETVWTRVARHAGEPFVTVTGRQFTYTVKGKVLRPDHTNRNLPKSGFEKILPLLPLSTTTQVNRLGVQGPSYVFAILMDHRIRDQGW